MKKILKLTGIGMALALTLTGCNETPEGTTNTNGASVVATNKAAKSSSSEASPSSKVKTDERADRGEISIVEFSSENTEPSESTAEAPEYRETTPDEDELPYETDKESEPKDYIPDAVYEVEVAMKKIVDSSMTFEVLKEKIEEYNADNRNGEAYNVTEVTVFDDDEEISSGLLKDGMCVRVDFGSGGYSEYRVTRAPKDCIPDEFKASAII